MQIGTAIERGARLISTLCEWVRIADSTTKAVKAHSGIERAAHIVAATTLAASSALSTIELGHIYSPAALNTIKKLEVGARCLDVVGSAAGATADLTSIPSRERFSAKKIVKAVEQGILAPLLGLTRSVVELVNNETKSPDTHQNTDQEEMKDTLASLCEMGFRIGTMTKTTREAHKVYFALCAHFFARPHPVPAENEDQLLPPPVPPPQVDPHFGPLNLVDMPEIPGPLEDDIVFKEVICPITQCPVRDPVLDPTNRITIYEKRAIVAFIRNTEANGRAPFSPLTHRPINVESLIEMPHRKALITNRLRFHQERLRQFIQENLAAPVDPQAQGAADRELG